MTEYGTMNIQVETVTPKTAAKWLAKNTHNRHLRTRLVDRLARDMTAGKWQTNGDAIRFSEEGTLLDGQHRLTACVESGAKFTTVVIRGLDPETMHTVDQGAKRSGGDVLKLRGEQYANDLANALGWLWSMEQGQAYIRNSLKPTPDEMFEVLDRFPEVRPCVKAMRINAFNTIGRGRGMFAAFYTTIYRYDQERADEFMQRVITGANAGGPGDPALTLRNRLINGRVNPKYSMLSWVQLTMLAYAWRAFYSGAKLSRLTVSADRPFPKYPGRLW